MKINKVCPKCKSTDIIKVEGSAKGYGAGNNIPIGHTILSYVKVARYICCDCGYVEEWVDMEDIPKIKKKYE